MTDTSRADHELIRRYLADGLSDDEEQMVATRIVNEPGFRSEIELTAALKGGFRELERRGELSALLGAARPGWRQPHFALAAALGIAAVGGLLSLVIHQFPGDPAPPAVSETLYFETTRGGASQADVVWRRTGAPSRVELRFDVGLEPAATYHVTLQRIGAGAGAEVIASLDADQAGGEVVLTLDGALLEPGDYEATLEPLPSGTAGGAVSYTLRVGGP